jgi:hypothetical protein
MRIIWCVQCNYYHKKFSARVTNITCMQLYIRSTIVEPVTSLRGQAKFEAELGRVKSSQN